MLEEAARLTEEVEEAEEYEEEDEEEEVVEEEGGSVDGSAERTSWAMNW